MKQKLYDRIIAFISENGFKDIIAKLSAQFPEVEQMTLSSIYSQEMQKVVKKTYHNYSQPSVVSDIYERCMSAVTDGNDHGILIRIAEEYNFSAAILARLVLEYYFNTVYKDGFSSTGISKSQLNKYLREPSLIPEKHLGFEIFQCLLYDDTYGHFADSVKYSVGHEYECMLKRKLADLGISFQDEDTLRSKGYDKTPDVKLDVPVVVNKHTVNWIESKASFGDEESHKVYLRDQFWSYWNRFGPGMVIYWFGFIEELDQQREKGIMLCSSFPEHVMSMSSYYAVSYMPSIPLE